MCYPPSFDDFLKREWEFEIIPGRSGRLPGWGLHRWNSKHGFDPGWNHHPADLARWAYELGVEHGRQLEAKELEDREFFKKLSEKETE
jgi:hypothetical protein